ncbi:MAG: hypothetical protein AB1758_15165 [Candidatus Eremiobacterota bacterium]
MVGGLAVGARAEPRYTRALDVAVTVSDDAEAERIVHAMLRTGYQLEALLEQAAIGRLATVRLKPPSGREILDLLFASSGIELDVVAGAEPLEVFPDVTVPIALRGDLMAMKALANRPQDLADLDALRRQATPADLERAQQSARKIQQRGFARGQDLVARLSQLLR